MRYIQNIDDAIMTSREVKEVWVVSKPLEAYGLLKWEIRVRKAIAVLFGKADAFTYTDSEGQ